MFNGFLNRFVPIWTERAQLLPLGSEPNPRDERETIARIAAYITAARSVDHVGSMTSEAREWWCAHYAALSTGSVGRVGAATQRGPAIIRRIALLHALSDGGRTIDVQHFQAAHALWQYAVATANHVFGGVAMSDLAMKIADALVRAGPEGMDRTTIRTTVVRSNGVKGSVISDALRELRASGQARPCHVGDTGGRAREVWIHIQHLRSEFAGLPRPASLPSLISHPSLTVEQPAPVYDGPRRHVEV